MECFFFNQNFIGNISDPAVCCFRQILKKEENLKLKYFNKCIQILF